MSMWEPFTENGRRSMVFAQEAAQELGHSYIAPEHIVIGIARDGKSPAATVLHHMDATYAALFDRTHALLPPQTSEPPNEMVFTGHAKRSIELAFMEARERNNNYIGTEHLLLGVLRECHGRPEGVFAELGITYDAVTEKLRRSLPEGPKEAEPPFVAIHHVQLAMPKGEEEKARAFYAGVLGMKEIEKPPELAARGGVWFSSGAVQLHLGIDEDFHSATKAHPALRCREYRTLIDDLKKRGVEVQDVQRLADEGPRAYLADPFGNRIELVG